MLVALMGAADGMRLATAASFYGLVAAAMRWSLKPISGGLGLD
jgi:hypothetical protein